MQFVVFKEIISIIEQGELNRLFRAAERWENLKTSDGKLLFDNTAEIIENIERLALIDFELILEMDLNSIESAEKTTQYRLSLTSKLEEKYHVIISLIKRLDKKENIDEAYIQNQFEVHYVNSIKTANEGKYQVNLQFAIYWIAKVLTDLRNIIEAYHLSLENPIAVQQSATKILYLAFSNLLELYKSALEANSKTKITNVKLAEVIAFLSNENVSNIKVLLTQLTFILQGKPYPKVFKIPAIEAAIIQLDKDGFDTSKLAGILLKMDQLN